MKKIVKLAGVALVITALVNMEIKWPVLMAEAEEQVSEAGQLEKTGTGQEEAEGSWASGAGQDGAGEGQSPSGTGQDGAEGNQGAIGADQEGAGEGQSPSGTGQEGTEGNQGAIGADQDGAGEGQSPSGTGQEGTEGNQGAPGSGQDGTGENQGTSGAGQDVIEGSQGATGTETEGTEGSQTVDGSRQGESGEIPQGGWKRTSGALDEENAQWIEAAGDALTQIAAERDIMALVYLSDTYPIRTSPSMESEVKVTVLSGQTVCIEDVYVDDDAEIWHYVELEYNGSQVSGYVPRANLACSDARFLEWEEQYGFNFSASAYTADEATQDTRSYPDIDQFPESYRAPLRLLKQKHPNWTFVVMNTTLDWGISVASELQDGRSLVYRTLPDWAKNGLYDSKNWYYASEAALKLYMDPRNSLTEDAIFQFEQLTYNEEYHTLDAMNVFLKNTFMNDSKPVPGSSATYASLFWSVGREEGRKVSPFHLAARVLQEQGQGTSPLISGNYSGYEGYYNYFNIGASGTTDRQVIESGLKYAKEHGWSSAEAAIRGGADFISANYIRKGQDTLYLQKFNVNPNGAYKPYTHQYMQNITAPTTEGLSIRRLYEDAGALDSTFVFKIPVYENMPGEACGVPDASTVVELVLPEGYGGTEVWLDGVAYQGEARDGKLFVTAPNGNVQTATLYQYNEAGVPVGMYVWELSYNGVVYTATPLPELRDLLTYHGFSIRITGKSGIRFKTGISTDVRSRLTLGGINGYTLKEYGTLITSNANLGQYPMIKGGEKISSGLSYGTDTDGTWHDVVFETVDGRYRYTSVLVGIPVEHYKTDFAFRGYAVLEKNGVQVCFYGPPVARNIYTLAQQLIAQGTYQNGSEADAFLRKLISDADGIQ